MEIVFLKIKLSVVLFALFFAAPMISASITRWLSNKYMKWGLSHHFVYIFTFAFGMYKMAEFVSTGGFDGWIN